MNTPPEMKKDNVRKINLIDHPKESMAVMEIKMDCPGYKKFKAGLWPFFEEKTFTRQFFRSESQLTLEFIRTASEEEIGRHLKSMVSDLDSAIANYSLT